MDAHPARFPGKRRTGPKSSGGNGDGPMPTNKPPWKGVTAAQPRIKSKRAFGVPRCTNVPVEKPVLISKTRKVPAAAKKPSNPDPASVVGKKKPQITLQESKKAVAEGGEDDEPEETVRTPTLSIKPAAASGTPYLSAQNCSKCRLDKLESSTYWLGQIRLAESTGKHFVAAAFFSLALECHAQPFYKLRNELRHYVKRHRVSSVESIWTNLSLAYGLSKEKSVYDPCDLARRSCLLSEMNNLIANPDAELRNGGQFHDSLSEKDDRELSSGMLDRDALEDECSKHDDKRFRELAEVKVDHNDEHEYKMEESKSVSVDNLTANECCVLASISNVANRFPGSKSSEKKAFVENLKKKSGICSNSSSQPIKTPTSCPSDNKGKENIRGNRANNSVKSNDGSRKKRSVQITGSKEERNNKSSTK
ncbi:hypothetical protein ZIOFF_016658 [Zingiber officinale]|uniref:Uncharacterized protein n=1 Tax=Zingiber officinale TaxID=94328 RepID=A0A8J5I2V9_ZINOF|nr:hypothetical protein ZIOFF_016658 [Zingiber officinale]